MSKGLKKLLLGDSEVDCELMDEMEIKEEKFSSEKYEKYFREKLESEAKSYFEKKEELEEKNRIENEVLQDIVKKYFPDGLPTDVPYDFLKIKPKKNRVNISKEDKSELIKRVKEIQKRQNEIINIFCNEETYLNLDSNYLIGNKVCEYKKLEGLKLIHLDTLQEAYIKNPLDGKFDKHFTEKLTVDIDSRF